MRLRAMLACNRRDARMFSSDLSRVNMKHRAVIAKRLAQPRMFSSVLASSVLRTIFHKTETKEKESNPQNIPHEEVFIGCTIIGIFFDSCIA